MPLFLWQGKVAPWGICFGFLRRGRSSVVCALRLSLFQNFQLKGPVSEATDLNFKPIYNWGSGRRGLTVFFLFFFFRIEKKILRGDVKDGTFVTFIRESKSKP